MDKYEKLGAFYLGRTTAEEQAPFLYDSKDLTTHGLVVGMTGSGKTGLSVVLLEEAAIDGIPALIIDPKGDMGNLMLQFPELDPEDFRPWVDSGEAARKGLSPDELATDTAASWRRGIAEWGQSGERIRRLREAAEVRLYTPESTAGRPIALLGAFDAPPEAVREDGDALRERVLNAVSGLLGLVGVDADPVTSREHILVSNILERAWSAGENRDLESILAEIQDPPFDKLGVMELSSFFPAKDRLALAMRLNNLLASPAFAAWRDGEPLNIPKLLYSDTGKPRLAVLSIAHLSDRERMFFVTLLLNEVISWMRGLEGTGSLRAILYMDEIFGYFPPIAAPPSKRPMLTLLKQARAYGVGVLLATQNPVDLDYKGLANMGTWFLGRLQTARDRDRLMDGLASASSGGAFDRRRMEEVLGSLDKRVFLVQNVHEDAPVVFHTRWALSYLRGPLTLEQVKQLSGPTEVPKPSAPPTPTRNVEPVSDRPAVPAGIEECFVTVAPHPGPEADSTYLPSLLGSVAVHYVRVGYDVDHFEKIHWMTPLDDEPPDWHGGQALDGLATSRTPQEGVSFSKLPEAATSGKSYVSWQKSFLKFLYQERPLTLRRSKKPKMYSRPHEDEAAFRGRLLHALHEQRDAELEKLRSVYAPKLAKLADGIRKAQSRLDREKDQYTAQKTQAVISIGETLLGALFGRKLASRTNVGRASKTARSATRASREREDVALATKRIQELAQKLQDLEAELLEKTNRLRDQVDPAQLELEELTLRFRKSDTSVERFALCWRASAGVGSKGGDGST